MEIFSVVCCSALKDCRYMAANKTACPHLQNFHVFLMILWSVFVRMKNPTKTKHTIWLWSETVKIKFQQVTSMLNFWIQLRCFINFPAPTTKIVENKDMCKQPPWRYILHIWNWQKLLGKILNTYLVLNIKFPQVDWVQPELTDDYSMVD